MKSRSFTILLPVLTNIIDFDTGMYRQGDSIVT